MHRVESEISASGDNNSSEINIYSIAEMIVKGRQIVRDNIHDNKAMCRAINYGIIDQYNGHFTIEEVRRVLVMAANTKNLTETDMVRLSGPFVMSTVEGWGYFKNKNHEAFLSVQELFKGTVVASTPLEDVRGIEVIKRGLRNLVNRWGSPDHTFNRY